MFGSAVLDTAIGLVFVFLLVSMLVTIANELIAAVLLSRAKWLRYGMERMLGSAWAAKIYSHPLVEGSTAGPRDADPSSKSDASAAAIKSSHDNGSSTGRSRMFQRGNGPSYLTSRAFTDVLLHFVQREDRVLAAVLAAVRAKLAEPVVDELDGAGLHAAVILAARNAVPADASTAAISDLARNLKARRDAFLTGLFDDLKKRVGPAGDAAMLAAIANLESVQKDLAPGDVQARLTAAIGGIANDAALQDDLTKMVGRIGSGYTVGNAVADIQRFIADMPTNYLQESIDRIADPKVRRTLHTLLDDAERDVEHFKRNIEVWFNNAMDRVSGWYKRQSQWVVGGLCVVAAVGLNVDSMAVVDYLQTNAGVRDALVAKAKAFSDKNAAAIAQPLVKVPADGTAAPPAPDPEKTMTALSTQLDGVRSELTGLKLPVGWKWAPDAPGTDAETAKRDPYRLEFRAADLGGAIGFHWLGWFITALAATLGAPFWFDTLNRIISIRSAGKSPDEEPRAPKVQPKPLAPGQAP